MRPNTEPLIRVGAKSSIKLSCKLDNFGPDKQHNDVVITGIRVGLPTAEDMYEIKMFNRVHKIKGNYKVSEIGFCDAEILFLNIVNGNTFEAEITTKDPENHPINIYGVDIFGKRKETINFAPKQKMISTACEYEHLTSSENDNNDVLKELLQSSDIPVLVNSDEKFVSTERLLATIRSRNIKDEKRLLFYITETCTNSVDFMDDQQIEHELFYHIYPLIGQYMCQVQENTISTTSYSHLILESLLRCLKQCLTKLGKLDELENIKYSCFIDYLKDFLEGQQTASPITIPQVCSFVKVASSFSQNALKSTKTTFLVTKLLTLFKNTVLKEIEVMEAEKKAIPTTEKDLYSDVINQIIELIFTLYQYIDGYYTLSYQGGSKPSQSYKTSEGSAASSKTLHKVLDLLKPMIYSPSDLVKRTTAVKIKVLVQSNLITISHIHKDGKDERSQSQIILNSSDLASIKNDIKHLMTSKIESGKDVDMEDEDEKNELDKAIALSLEEGKSEQPTDTNMQAQDSANLSQLLLSNTAPITLELLKYLKLQILNSSDR